MVTVDEDANCLDGSSPETAAARLTEWGADAIGCNCSVGPATVLTAIEPHGRQSPTCPGCDAQCRDAACRGGAKHLPLLAGIHGQLRPQAGQGRGAICWRLLRHHAGSYPVDEVVPARDGREEVAHHAVRKRRLHPRSNPLPWLSDRASVRSLPAAPLSPWWRWSRRRHRLQNGARGGQDAAAKRGPHHQRSRLVACLAAHERAEPMHPDSAEPAWKPCLHYTCRDRNLLSIQSGPARASSIGLKKYSLPDRRPAQAGQLPDATAVFDVDAIGLVNIVRRSEPRLGFGEQSRWCFERLDHWRGR